MEELNPDGIKDSYNTNASSTAVPAERPSSQVSTATPAPRPSSQISTAIPAERPSPKSSTTLYQSPPSSSGSSILDISVLERMNPTSEQREALTQACSQFVQARDCLLDTEYMLGAKGCYDDWLDKMKAEKRKLIAAGIITEEEEEEIEADFNRNGDICEAKAERESTWFGGRWTIHYRCFRPHVEKYLADLTRFFNCNELLQ